MRSKVRESNGHEGQRSLKLYLKWNRFLSRKGIWNYRLHDISLFVVDSEVGCVCGCLGVWVVVRIIAFKESVHSVNKCANRIVNTIYLCCSRSWTKFQSHWLLLCTMSPTQSNFIFLLLGAECWAGCIMHCVTTVGNCWEEKVLFIPLSEIWNQFFKFVFTNWFVQRYLWNWSVTC